MEKPASRAPAESTALLLSALLVLATSRCLRTGFKSWVSLEEFALTPLLRFWFWYVLAFACLIAAIAGPPRALVTSIDALSARLRSSAAPSWLRLAGRELNRYAPLVAVLFVIGQRFVRRYGVDYFGTDGLLFSQFAVDSLFAGKNPYSLSMADAFTHYNSDPAFGTYRIDGTLVAELSYPAMCVLAFMPQRLLNIANLDLTSLVVLAIVFVWLVVRSPGLLKWLAPAMLWAQWDLVAFTAGGVFDILWTLPLMASMVPFARGRLGLAGVLLGVACSVKQTPWFVAPFLVLWLILEAPAHRTRIRRIATLSGAAIATFAVINLPFIIADPSGWLRGVLVPVAGGAPLVEIGVGPIMANIAGLSHQPKAFFSLLMACAFTLTAIAYTLWFPRLKWLAFSAPMLVLWFNYRSLQNYFIFLLPVAYMGVLLHRETLGVVAYRWRHRALIFGAACAGAVVLLAGASLLLAPKASLDAQVEIRAMRDPDMLGRVSEMTVDVVNNSSAALTPTFGIVHSRHQTPVHWTIASGPATLAPGASATYELLAPIPTATVPYDASLHLRVYDLGTEHRRSVIRKRLLSEQPPLIRNGGFKRWVISNDLGIQEPFEWTARLGEDVETSAASFEDTGDGARIVVAGADQDAGAPPYQASITQTVERLPATLHVEATTDQLGATGEAGVKVINTHVCMVVMFSAEPTMTVREAFDEERACRIVALPAQPGQRLVADVPLRELAGPESAKYFERKRATRITAFVSSQRGRGSTVFHRVVGWLGDRRLPMELAP